MVPDFSRTGNISLITSERYSAKLNAWLLLTNLIKYTEDKAAYEYCHEIETGLKFKFAGDQAQAGKTNSS